MEYFMRQQIGFNGVGRDKTSDSNYAGFYRIHMVGGVTLYGKIKEETFDNINLLPHVVDETSNGGRRVLRLESKVPTEISPGHILFRQPVSDAYVNSYLDSESFEQGGGI
jgi:hypothetical protein